jgi:ABC-type branched-subunit amino acid transport system substrate-binding protein
MSYNSGLTIFILLTGLILCPFAAALDSPDDKNNITLPGSENLKEPGVIPVGILLPQSGFVSDIGKEYEDAFGIASNEYPGSVLMPVLMDAGSDSKTSVAAWNKMKTEYPNLSIIITIASWTTNAIYPEAAKDGILHIALGSAVVSQNNDSDRLVRFTPGVEQESPVLAKFLKQYDRVLILGSDNDYSNGYIKALESLIPEKIVGIHVRQLKGQICKLAKFSVTNQEYNSNTKSKPLYIFGAALR